MNNSLIINFRFQNHPSKITATIDKHRKNINLEMQQRSCEFSALIKIGQIRFDLQKPEDFFQRSSKKNPLTEPSPSTEILDRMPAVEKEVKSEATTPVSGRETEENANGNDSFNNASNGVSNNNNNNMLEETPLVNASAKPAASDSLLDMDALLGLAPMSAPAPAPAPALSSVMIPLGQPATASSGFQSGSGAGMLDLLAPMRSGEFLGSGVLQHNPQSLLLSSSSSSSSAAAAAAAAAPAPAPASGSAATTSNSGGYPPMTVYEDNGFLVTFTFQKDKMQVDTTNITANFFNNSASTVTDLVFQAAVPKYIRLQMNAPSSTEVPPASSGKKPVIQTMKVVNSLQGTKPILMKIKLDFKLNGQPIQSQVQLSDFPQGI